MKDKLQSLIDTFFCSVDINKFYSQNQKEKLADWLRANGVTIPPVQLGDIVCFYIAHPDKPFELKTGRVFSVEYTFSVKPLLTIRYDDNSLDFLKKFLGYNAFTTEEEARAAMKTAEQALKEMQTNGNS